MSNYLLSFFLNFILILSYGQSDINYTHKKINKEIEKFWGIEQPTIEEISIPDSIKDHNYVQGKYFIIADTKSVSHLKYMYIGRVNSCRVGGCSISMDPGENFETEYFDYFILFDANLDVQLVRIYNYVATHGHEVSAKGWLKQFEGYNGIDTLEVGKSVDAISGATISVYGITEDVQLKTQLLKKLNKKYKLTSTQ